MRAGRERSAYLRDTLAATQKARAFVGDAEFAAFAADEKTIFAVIRALEIIGQRHFRAAFGNHSDSGGSSLA